MRGKDKCRMLRQIRERIAEENDIRFITEDCSYKGECKGTCPRCESELRYLEDRLEKRRAAGKKIALAGISLGLTAALSGCSATETISELWDKLSQKETQTEIVETEGEVSEVVVLDGEVAYTPEPEPEELSGIIPEASEAVDD